MDSGDAECRHSVCYASYGYMGDLLRQSEGLRWAGWAHGLTVGLKRKDFHGIHAAIARHAVATHHECQMMSFTWNFESRRWLGPLRYTLAGVIVFLKGRSYSAHISCVPAPQLGSASCNAQYLLRDQLVPSHSNLEALLDFRVLIRDLLHG